MLKVNLDMEMPESCKDCPLWTDPCGDCIIDIPAQRSTYPYCNSSHTWSEEDTQKYNRFADKPEWCPLERDNAYEDH